jgi:hypothetical protein
MHHPTLMTFEGPSDKDLFWLMKEVAKEAKEKSLLSDERLLQKIQEEIKVSEDYFNLKKS